MEQQQGIEHLTQSPLAQEGVFRAFPVAWTIEEAKDGTSKSVGIAIRFAIYQQWSPEAKTWSEEWPAGYYVDGRSYVVGKEGNVNQSAVSQLSKAGLWDGDWDKLNGPPPSVYVHVDVKNEPYQGQDKFRAKWINPDADEPVARGGFAPVNDQLLSSLRQRFQSSTRAIAGGNATGRPAAPPTAAPAPAIQPAGQPAPGPAPATRPQVTPTAAPARPAPARPTAQPTHPGPAQAPQSRPPMRPAAAPPARPTGPTPAIQQPAEYSQPLEDGEPSSDDIGKPPF